MRRLLWDNSVLEDECGSVRTWTVSVLTQGLSSCPPGPDCSLTVPSTESFWVLPSVKPFGTSLARASHKAVVQEKVMWVVGGYTFNYSSFQMILK